MEMPVLQALFTILLVILSLPGSQPLRLSVHLSWLSSYFGGGHPSGTPQEAVYGRYIF